MLTCYSSSNLSKSTHRLYFTVETNNIPTVIVGVVLGLLNVVLIVYVIYTTIIRRGSGIPKKEGNYQIKLYCVTFCVYLRKKCGITEMKQLNIKLAIHSL